MIFEVFNCFTERLRLLGDEGGPDAGEGLPYGVKEEFLLNVWWLLARFLNEDGLENLILSI